MIKLFGKECYVEGTWFEGKDSNDEKFYDKFFSLLGFKSRPTTESIISGKELMDLNRTIPINSKPNYPISLGTLLEKIIPGYFCQQTYIIGRFDDAAKPLNKISFGEEMVGSFVKNFLQAPSIVIEEKISELLKFVAEAPDGFAITIESKSNLDIFFNGENIMSVKDNKAVFSDLFQSLGVTKDELLQVAKAFGCDKITEVVPVIYVEPIKVISATKKDNVVEIKQEKPKPEEASQKEQPVEVIVEEHHNPAVTIELNNTEFEVEKDGGNKLKTMEEIAMEKLARNSKETAATAPKQPEQKTEVQKEQPTEKDQIPKPEQEEEVPQEPIRVVERIDIDLLTKYVNINNKQFNDMPILLKQNIFRRIANALAIIQNDPTSDKNILNIGNNRYYIMKGTIVDANNFTLKNNEKKKYIVFEPDNFFFTDDVKKAFRPKKR